MPVTLLGPFVSVAAVGTRQAFVSDYSKTQHIDDIMVPGTRGRSVAVVLAGVGVVTMLALGAGLLLAGGNALPPADETVQQYDSLDAYNATYTITSEKPAETRTVRAQVTVSPDSGAVRVEVLAPPDRAGNLRIFNGSVSWFYNATENTVTRITQPDPRVVSRERTVVRSAVTAANSEEPTSQVSPLPVAPGSGRDRAVGNTTGTLEGFYEGTETVAGREAHVVSLRPVANDTTSIAEQTVWLDTEYFIELRSETTLEFGGNRTVLTRNITDVSFEPDLPSGVFEFDPSAGTQPERRTGAVTAYESRADLAAATALPVPDPTVPDRFDLSAAQLVVRPNRTGAVLRYTSGTNVITAIAGNGSAFDTVAGEPVPVGNRTGRFDVSGRAGRVVWTCGSYEYAVTGRVPQETLVEVARSVADSADACVPATASDPAPTAALGASAARTAGR
jgi:outer membrane lipoprotein-sorting protein